jgi:hypothetical protein
VLDLAKGASVSLPPAQHRELQGPSQPGPAATGGGSKAGVDLAIIALLAIAALACSAAVRPLPAGSDPHLAELERALTRAGRPPAPDTTLAQLEHRFRGSPDAAAYIRAIRVSRYGGEPQQPTASQRRALRARLAEGLGPTGRLRALWALPPRLGDRA